MTPVLTELGSSAIQVLTRGSEDQLAPIFPSLSPVDRALRAQLDPSEAKTRLLWNFAQFLVRLAGRQALLLIFEDLHWADDSSIELLHFVGRHLGEAPVVGLCVHNDAVEPTSGALASTEQSLLSLNMAELVLLAPLSREETGALISQRFAVSETVVGTFADRIHEWTGGNPFFLVEVLKSLVESAKSGRKGTRGSGGPPASSCCRPPSGIPLPRASLGSAMEGAR